MAGNPILTVLNTADFINDWERQPGGNTKDFYANRNQEFVDHKVKLSRQLVAIKLNENEFTDISYAKLILRPSALAKSHRPTAILFKKDLAPIVGAGDIGELFIELTPRAIDRINTKVNEAETEVRSKINREGKSVPAPSNLRSEVGAIDEILPYSLSDKRKFSVRQAVQWLSNPYTGGSYLVELFETPPPRQDWDMLSNSKFKLFKSFVDGLANIGNGLVASKLLGKEKDTATISVRLENSSNPAFIQFSPKYSPGCIFHSIVYHYSAAKFTSHSAGKFTRVPGQTLPVIPL